MADGQRLPMETQIMAETTMLDQQSASIFAHQTNIDRYRRILGAELTFGERRYVERCLAEEQAALVNFLEISSH